MAEGGEGIIPDYKAGQPIKTGESFILKPDVPYKPTVDTDLNDLVVQDKALTSEQADLHRVLKSTEEQVDEARALLRELPPNASIGDKQAAEHLLEEALKNATPASEAHPEHPGRLLGKDEANNKIPPAKLNFFDRAFVALGNILDRKKAA